MDEQPSSDMGPDPGTDYPLIGSLDRGLIWRDLLVSKLLEAAAIRHCLAGDLVNQAMGSDVLLTYSIVLVAEEHLAQAGSLLSSTGTFIETTCTYYQSSTTDDYFPGFAFVTKGIDPQKYPNRIMVVPAGYFHVDLSAANYARNTVFLSEPRCRLPNVLHYIDALVSTVVERTIKADDYNGHITTYFEIALLDIWVFTPASIRSRLPPEDLLMIELYPRVILPSARKTVCVQWGRIRRGETTVEEARARIPRKDLEVAAIRARYQAKARQEAAAREESKVARGEGARVVM